MNYNLSFDIAGLIINFLLYLILKTQYVSSSKTNLLFRHFVVISFFSGLLDLVSAITIENAALIPPVLNLILNTLYIYSAYITAFLIDKYICTMIDFKTRTQKILFTILSTVFGATLILNFFTGCSFSFSGADYIKGPLFLFNFFCPMFFLFHVSVILILKRKKFTKKQLILNWSIVIYPLIAAVLQIIFSNQLLTSFAFSLSILTVLFSLETPDFVELEYLRKNLEAQVVDQTRKAIEKQRKLEMMSLESIQALVQAIDEKDEYTNGHSLRVSVYSVLLAQALSWEPDEIEKLRISALLHDIGKIGVPDSILNKPNKLTQDEFRIIKSHTAMGGKILHKLSSLKNAEAVALYHHERYDGTGYPGTYSGKDIPEFARIVTIADSFDAMTTNRIYRDRLDKAFVIKQLKENSGKQFDPDLVKEFIKLIEIDVITL